MTALYTDSNKPMWISFNWHHSTRDEFKGPCVLISRDATGPLLGDLKYSLMNLQRILFSYIPRDHSLIKKGQPGCPIPFHLVRYTITILSREELKEKFGEKIEMIEELAITRLRASGEGERGFTPTLFNSVEPEVLPKGGNSVISSVYVYDAAGDPFYDCRGLPHGKKLPLPVLVHSNMHFNLFLRNLRTVLRNRSVIKPHLPWLLKIGIEGNPSTMKVIPVVYRMKELSVLDIEAKKMDKKVAIEVYYIDWVGAPIRARELFDQYTPDMKNAVYACIKGGQAAFDDLSTTSDTDREAALILFHKEQLVWTIDAMISI